MRPPESEMTDESIPKAPTGTRAAGKRLWDAVPVEYVLQAHELGMLREMVRTTDLLNELDAPWSAATA